MLWTFYVRFTYPYHGYVTFQMNMDRILEQVDGAIGIADDVVVYAKSEEHDKILHRLM